MNNHEIKVTDSVAVMAPASTTPATSPASHHLGEWLTLEEVARCLKASRTSIWRYRREGLKATRLGGLVRVQARDLQEFMVRHRC